jgi:hypothetical protein
MELHMNEGDHCELDYAGQDGPDVDAELTAMLADPALKRDGGRLLRVLADIANRGLKAKDDNVHLSSTTPILHAVRVGVCVAYYAYGQRDGVATMFLLGFYNAGMHLQSVGTAAARLANIA